MKKKSIKLNFIMNALLSLSNFIFPIITFPYVSRVLLPSGNGKVSTAISIIAYFNIFAQLGVPTYGVRACAKVRDNREELTRVTHELLFINLITSAITYVFVFAAMVFVPVMREEKMLYIITSSSILLTSIGMEWLYRALEQYTYITVRSVVFKFIAMAGMFLLIHEQSDYVIYGGIAIFAASASNILNFINARKYIDWKPVGGYNPKRHMKFVGIFLAMSCATTIYTNLDTVMLRFMTGDDEVGLYNAAVKIKYVLLSVVTSLGTVLLPRVSYYIENNMMDEFKRVTAKAFNFVFLFAGGATIYFIIMAKPCIMFISGELYKGSIIPMQIIVPTIFIIGLSNILGIQMLVPLGKEKALLWAEIGGAVIDLIVNALLIPTYKSAGAAVGTLFAEIFVTTYLFIYLRNELKGVIKNIQFHKIAIALVVATGIMVPGVKLADYLITLPYVDGIISRFESVRLEVESLISLGVTFIIFSVVYAGLLIVLKESLSTELVGSVKGKIVSLKDKIIA